MLWLLCSGGASSYSILLSQNYLISILAYNTIGDVNPRISNKLVAVSSIIRLVNFPSVICGILTEKENDIQSKFTEAQCESENSISGIS